MISHVNWVTLSTNLVLPSFSLTDFYVYLYISAPIALSQISSEQKSRSASTHSSYFHLGTVQTPMQSSEQKLWVKECFIFNCKFKVFGGVSFNAILWWYVNHIFLQTSLIFFIEFCNSTRSSSDFFFNFYPYSNYHFVNAVVLLMLRELKLFSLKKVIARDGLEKS